MHINEIRYLSDDTLREVFKECTKNLFERDNKLPLSEHDVCKYIHTVSNIEAIDIEDLKAKAYIAVREYINEQIADWSGMLYDFWKKQCW